MPVEPHKDFEAAERCDVLNGYGIEHARLQELSSD
jgi:hypothetical protein